MAEAELHARPDPVTTLKIGLGNAGSLTAAGFSIPFLRGRGRADRMSVCIGCALARNKGNQLHVHFCEQSLPVVINVQMYMLD